ncbi:unnamed protein product [Urochloa decumbens]|uniref:Secreted protein n=1 Tax=Urochloa decumbens TaxID=240449 RepID=A0ABC9DDS4_9POAL
MFRKVFAWVLIAVFLMAGFMCSCFLRPNLLHADSRSRWEEEGTGRRRRYPGRRRRRRLEERVEQAVVSGSGDEDEVRGGASCA